AAAVEEVVGRVHPVGERNTVEVQGVPGDGAVTLVGDDPQAPVVAGIGDQKALHGPARGDAAGHQVQAIEDGEVARLQTVERVEDHHRPGGVEHLVVEVGRVAHVHAGQPVRPRTVV